MDISQEKIEKIIVSEKKSSLKITQEMRRTQKENFPESLEKEIEVEKDRSFTQSKKKCDIFQQHRLDFFVAFIQLLNKSTQRIILCEVHQKVNNSPIFKEHSIFDLLTDITN